MIRIKYNNEIYEVYSDTIYRDEVVACSDYAASIEEHVSNICSILHAAGVPYITEDL